MKPLLSLIFAFGLVANAQALPIEACNQDVDSDICHYYLEGVVDGALMYKPYAVDNRLESSGYASRALKYRSGKRFQQANRTYCESRIPNRDDLVKGVSEAFVAGDIKSTEALTDVVFSLMDCQRLK
ncbi:hypothetical protein LZP69_07655 [Shewanella sp. AS1]|uniref:hypothetical protein n=1 Tax=Shewanella sp. AS1 TaxID=2907626 RepID=UPI001F3CC856|nr:hypothetical protein [Shewanella sp. AS1]MCE9679053.1 hypothetical protein [Shewanella sp. AS1]